MLNPHWGRPAIGKKKKSPVSMHAELLQLCPTVCNPVDWPAMVLCQGDSTGKDTGVYWPVLVATPFKSTIYPASLAASSPEYLVLPEPL